MPHWFQELLFARRDGLGRMLRSSSAVETLDTRSSVAMSLLSCKSRGGNSASKEEDSPLNNNSVVAKYLGLYFVLQALQHQLARCDQA